MDVLSMQIAGAILAWPPQRADTALERFAASQVETLMASLNSEYSRL